MISIRFLHLVAGKGEFEMCKFLVEEVGVNIDVKTGRGDTPLIIATKWKKVDFAKYLIERGAEITMTDSKGLTALHCSAAYGCDSILKTQTPICQLCWEEFQTKVRWDQSLSENDVYYAFLARAANRYTDMLSKWKRRFELTEIAPNIDNRTWESLLLYWAREDVKQKSLQCKKNRESEPGGVGTGMSRHRGGAKSVIERALDYENTHGRPASEWQLVLDLHGPKTPGGSYTYGKMENLIVSINKYLIKTSLNRFIINKFCNTA
ncbi:hypothetical protein ACS0TY_034533 [Phlomoides rotata]